MEAYEKLGAFYLGKRYQVDQDAVVDELLLYDSKDLCTHAVCVGMTGSGKTGLCVGLLEEAALDGIPALIIDPKGDLGNLLLTFPDLAPADFEPWVDPGEARRKGETPKEFAAKTAALWERGLGEWGQDGKRIKRLRDAAEFSIYTPGLAGGRPLRVLQSLEAPKSDAGREDDALRERVQAAVSGLLSLLGVEADPVRSREHVLLSNLLDRAWREGRDLGLATLIAEIQQPPFDRLGVMDLESFFPAKDRTELAMRLNGLLASPGFAAWLEGEPLDVQSLLYTADGRPRHTILSIAHLSDAERMFFVTVLLNEVVTWMRAQPGTSSLRAILYMDEVFGYLPPTANPPSKLPLLTMLKQARAFGLGLVLATQNPVDLDYKALSNAGTWFIGRLQTERDKLRVLDGLEGASAEAGAEFDRQKMERIISGLKSRVFLLNNVHEDRPELFHTRWVMSYLRGPLTRSQIQELCAPAAALAEPAAAAAPAPAAEPVRASETQAADRPLLPTGIDEAFLSAVRGTGGTRIYRPALLASAQLHYTDRSAKVDHWERTWRLVPLRKQLPADLWESAQALASRPELGAQPAQGIKFAALPAPAARAKSYTTWAKKLKTSLYRTEPLTIYRAPDFKVYSEIGEDEAAFRVRVGQLAREKRDLDVEKLRKRYAPKIRRLEERIRTAADRVERERAQHRDQKVGAAVSLGATVLGALFGRRAASVGTVGRAATTIRSASRASREKEDIARALEKVEDLREQLEELEAEFQEQVDELEARIDPQTLEITDKALRPRKTDLDVETLQLVWTPWSVSSEGIAEPLYEVS